MCMCDYVCTFILTLPSPLQREREILINTGFLQKDLLVETDGDSTLYPFVPFEFCAM